MNSIKNSKLPEDKIFGGTEQNNYEDKISLLHEDLLIHILKFLPTRDVVATMFLSKRWRSIWKMVPRLEYKITKSNNKKKTVWWFLNKSLKQHEAPILESLSIELDKRCPKKADFSKWVARAIDRQVRMLRLIFERSAQPIALPTNLYTCETLVHMILKGNILIDVPSSVRLTSLKKLVLIKVVYKDEVSVTKLLSRSLILEELYVFRYRNDNVNNFIVEVPSLKFFFYKDSKDNGGNFVMNCPALNMLHMYSYMKTLCSFKNMSCLETLSVIPYLVSGPDEKFLIPFSSVKCLELAMIRGMDKCCGAAYFPRLRDLTIYTCWIDWMGSLLLLLSNSPSLKHLKIDNPKILAIIPATWNQPNSVPICVSSNLEVFKWHGYKGRTKEKKLAKYILGNSMCLKYAEFGVFQNSLEIRKKISEELDSMFRASTSTLKVFDLEVK